MFIMSTKEEMEDEYDDSDEEMLEGSNLSPENIAKSALTGRGITLQNLMADGIIEAGLAVLSLKYLGRKFIADLLPNGHIQTPATKEVFTTPSAWAMHCKWQINPEKKSGCGWASVMYKGRKLDSWKTAWFRKRHPNSPARSNKDTESPRSVCSDVSLNGDFNSHLSRLSEGGILNISKLNDSKGVIGNIEEARLRLESPLQRDVALELTPKPAHTITHFLPGKTTAHTSPENTSDKTASEEQEEALNLSLKQSTPSIKAKLSPAESDQAHSETNNNISKRLCVRHASLQKRSQKVDPNLLVQCETFSSLEKIQPFSVSITSNATLLMDFHSHLTSSEVVGYLAGKWDQSSQHLSVIQAYPCRCRLADTQKAMIVEEEIQSTMERVGLSVVGWYHSHPYCQSHPSVKDIDCQKSYQLRMKGKGSTYFPCIGCIVAPYNRETSRRESSFQMFMVMPPLESQPSDYGIPVTVKYSLHQNKSVTEDLLAEMKATADFYRGASDYLKFRQTWQPSISYIDKLKGSLARRLPEDQMDSCTFLDFVQHLLMSVK